MYIVSSFYKFIELDNFKDKKNPILRTMHTYQILGTIILAKEGINGSIAGRKEQIKFLYEHLIRDSRLFDLEFKEATSNILPFRKAKVKLKKEIVTLGLENINPLLGCGVKVNPEEWNNLISDPEVLVIDTRNDFEVNMGTFKNAVNPNTNHFRDFPQYVKNNLLDKKDKPIAMFCTGGIRCEKSSAYLKNLGFKNVYQLQGGILNYLNNIPKNKSLWQGNCFVFDDRINL